MDHREPIFTDPEVRVGMAIHGLQSAINEIQELRMDNNTSDLVLRDYPRIKNSAEWLSNLALDMEAAKVAAE